MNEALIIFIRELNSRVRTRAFWIGTLLGPVLMIGVASLQFLGGGAERDVVVVNEAAAEIGEAFVDLLTAKPRSDRDNRYLAQLRHGKWQDMRAELDASVLAKRIDAYIVIPHDILEHPSVSYRSRNAAGAGVLRELERAATRATQGVRIAAAGIPSSQLDTLLQSVRVKTARLTPTGERAEAAGIAVVVAYLTAFLSYMLILGYGLSILRSVLEEKTSRIAEIILSSVPAGRFLAGKLFGAAGAAALQVTAWFSMAGAVGIALLAADDSGVSDRLLESFGVPVSVLLWLVLFVLLGFLLYGSLFAAIGAAVTTEQEAQALQNIGVIPVLVPLAMVVKIVEDPTGTLATTLSLVPLTAPITMPILMVAAPVPLWQILTSLALLVAMFAAITWAAGKIFRIGILSTGRKATLPEMWRWLRSAG